MATEPSFCLVRQTKKVKEQMLKEVHMEIFIDLQPGLHNLEHTLTNKRLTNKLPIINKCYTGF